MIDQWSIISYRYQVLPNFPYLKSFLVSVSWFRSLEISKLQTFEASNFQGSKIWIPEIPKRQNIGTHISKMFKTWDPQICKKEAENERGKCWKQISISASFLTLLWPLMWSFWDAYSTFALPLSPSKPVPANFLAVVSYWEGAEVAVSGQVESFMLCVLQLQLQQSRAPAMCRQTWPTINSDSTVRLERGVFTQAQKQILKVTLRSLFSAVSGGWPFCSIWIRNYESIATSCGKKRFWQSDR